MITADQAKALADRRQQAYDLCVYCETMIMTAAMSGCRYVNIPVRNGESHEVYPMLRDAGYGLTVHKDYIHVCWGGTSGSGDLIS